MKLIISLLAIFWVCKITMAQSGKPMIGSDSGIKEKLVMIKNAFPDLVKAFGKNGQTSYGITDYQTDLKIGKSMIFLSKSALEQKLKIEFSNIYYSGTEDDFWKFGQEVNIYINDLFGDSYYSKPFQDGKNEALFYYENGKDISDSPNVIEVDFNQEIVVDVDIIFHTEKQ